jgi:hypothetical protein
MTYDYMETKDNLMGFLTSYVAAHPERKYIQMMTLTG